MFRWKETLRHGNTFIFISDIRESAFNLMRIISILLLFIGKSKGLRNEMCVNMQSKSNLNQKTNFFKIELYLHTNFRNCNERKASPSYDKALKVKWFLNVMNKTSAEAFISIYALYRKLIKLFFQTDLSWSVKAKNEKRLNGWQMRFSRSFE